METAVQTEELRRLFRIYGPDLSDTYQKGIVNGKYKEMFDNPKEIRFFEALSYVIAIFDSPCLNSLCITTDSKRDAVIETLTESFEGSLSRHYPSNIRIISLNEISDTLKEIKNKYSKNLEVICGKIKEGSYIDSEIISANCLITINCYDLSSKITTNKSRVKIGKEGFDNLWEYLTDPKVYEEKRRAHEEELKKRGERKLTNILKRNIQKVFIR